MGVMVVVAPALVVSIEGVKAAVFRKVILVAVTKVPPQKMEIFDCQKWQNTTGLNILSYQMCAVAQVPHPF